MSEVSEPSAFLRAMDRLFDVLCRICLIVAGTALVAMTVMFAWLVYGRYVLNDTPTWVEQVSHLLLMVIAFLGAAVGVRQDTHLSVVLFRSVVPSAVRTVFVFITDVLMAGFGGFLFWYGLALTEKKCCEVHRSQFAELWYSCFPLAILSVCCSVRTIA